MARELLQCGTLRPHETVRWLRPAAASVAADDEFFVVLGVAVRQLWRNGQVACRAVQCLGGVRTIVPSIVFCVMSPNLPCLTD